MKIRVEKNPSSEKEFQDVSMSMPAFIYDSFIEKCNDVADSWERYMIDVNAREDYLDKVQELCDSFMIRMGFSYKEDSESDTLGHWVNDGRVERFD